MNVPEAFRGPQGALDLTSVGGTAPLGRSVTAVARAVTAALELQPFPDGSEPRQDADELTRRLTERLELPAYAALRATTGGEAVDLALQLARSATGRLPLASITGSYHGGTSACLEVCGIDGWGTGPATLKFDFIADAKAALDALDAAGEGIAALVFEPVMTNRGFVTLERPVVAAIAEIAARRGFLVIHDEVGCGLGRTGALRAGAPDLPDIVTVGKTLGAGVYPIAAVLARPEIVERGKRRGRNFSLSWTPAGCAAGLAYFDELEKWGLVAQVEAIGARALAHVRRLLAGHPWVAGVFGRGFGLGIQLHSEVAARRMEIVRVSRERGVVVEPTPSLPGLRAMPALTMPEELVLSGLTTLCTVLDDLGR